MLYLCRYGELWLKSEQVRKRFAKILKENLVKQLKAKNIEARVVVSRERLFVEAAKEAEGTIAKTFGITSFSAVEKCGLAELDNVVVDVAKKFRKEYSFAIKVKRSGNHVFSSNEKAAALGSLVVEKFGNKVNLTSPDRTIFVEIRDQDCYVYSESIPAAGGLPVGSEGEVVVEFDGSKESIVAAYLVMKRGCKISLEGKGGSGKLESYDCEIPSFRAKNPKAIVSAGTDNFVSEKQLLTKAGKNNFPVFYPLVGMSEEKIENLYERI